MEARRQAVKPFYLAQGIKDVLIVNPYANDAWHFRRDGKQHLTLPAKVVLECGCRCTLG